MAQKILPRPEQVRAARSLLGWSQQDLASKAGVAVSTVADFERGQRSPVQNNALAIQRTLETAGVQFTETGVSHGFHWTFMTERGMSDLIITFTPEAVEPVVDFASIFGEVEPPKVAISKIHCATPELRSKVTDFVDRHGAKLPHLHRLNKMLADMNDGEFFLLLPTPPSSTAEQYQYERALHQLNHPQKQPLDEHLQLFGLLLEKYDLHNPRTDKRFDIGNARTDDRTCRFCGRTKETGAKFKKEAHAIPASLGNKHLKLCDECDECNGHFGTEIEPTLVELLNVQRVFLGIESRGTSPVIKFPGGQLFRDKKHDNLMVMASRNISEDASGVLRARLDSGKLIVPQNFYRALSKIALSVIPEEELAALKKTIRWVRYGESPSGPLPKIAAAVVMLPPDPSAQITLYVRKESSKTLPHVVCEFRLGCYLYVYALPFSERDDGDLIGFFEQPEFQETFRHYALVPSWNQQDYSGNKEIQVIQNITLRPSNAPDRNPSP
ncbi:helix-turn-helix domain-containing protein [Paraburkholderia acidipaludis]|uniref:helix-turn-helix domain-containing protein n=1 Tax=Paraburkholderia acidipaludis TaxID=660537 RepID=UPI0009FE5EAB|nr:helix-turn-helix domain-containing protein [Paraburkholderia acidipaludis]